MIVDFLSAIIYDCWFFVNNHIWLLIFCQLSYMIVDLTQTALNNHIWLLTFAHSLCFKATFCLRDTPQGLFFSRKLHFWMIWTCPIWRNCTFAHIWSIFQHIDAPLQSNITCDFSPNKDSAHSESTILFFRVIGFWLILIDA